MNTDGNLDALNRHLHEQEEYDARFITCPECDGEGQCEYDDPRPDYVNGGEIHAVWDTCETCHGSGEIEREDDE